MYSAIARIPRTPFLALLGPKKLSSAVQCTYVLRNDRLTFLHLVPRHVFVLGKSEYADWCTAFMHGLDFDFFIRFRGIGCIQVATIVYGYCKQQSGKLFFPENKRA